MSSTRQWRSPTQEDLQRLLFARRARARPARRNRAGELVVERNVWNSLSLHIYASRARKGMALVDPLLAPTSYWEFQAEILVLHHQTTLSGVLNDNLKMTWALHSPPPPPHAVGYAPIMHCGVVSQSARITTIRSLTGEDIPALRTGDRAIICCRLVVASTVR